MLITIFQWPVPTGNTGQTPPPLHHWDFEDGAQWGNEYKLLLPSMLAGGLCWWISAAGFVVAAKDKDAGKKFNDNVVSTVQTLASFVNILLGSWYSYSNATTDGEKTLAIIPAVISNLSYIDSVIAAGYTIDAFGSDIPWIKWYIDVFGNYATVAIDIGEAIAAVAE